ncbi:HAD-IIB family hydrolase [Acinetobacter sp. B10A]|uniref:HAD-IIB family hydrolase n=1 Tax=Acinetobacter baretiae TaxID=2605383 RepID=UPI001B3C7EBF|nr:HAD-IIB family hydrolase [Acinetobacter baretiae]MBF7684424.1 HAD-IIB family hydrolase [Acinetobacter baretiae]
MLDLSSPLMVITDLDGSLLDHHSYDWQPAQAWLNQLHAHQIPVVFCTSKTALEVQTLQRSMQLEHWPFICENGATVCINQSFHIMATHPQHALNYAQICQKVAELKQQYTYSFIGFSEMSAQDVHHYTGLSLSQAEHAKDRTGSEPLLWQDNEQQRIHFIKRLNTLGLELIQGGRFWHVINQGANKAFALDYLLKHYPHRDQKTWCTIGLGDGPNDIPLLEYTNYAVAIKNHQGQHVQLKKQQQVKYTNACGPTGWAEGLTFFIQHKNV